MLKTLQVRLQSEILVVRELHQRAQREGAQREAQLRAEWFVDVERHLRC